MNSSVLAACQPGSKFWNVSWQKKRSRRRYEHYAGQSDRRGGPLRGISSVPLPAFGQKPARWTFGGLYPEEYCRAQAGSDASSNQTQCLVLGSTDTILETGVRFLQVTKRTAGEVAPALENWQEESEPPFRPVEVLQIGDQAFHSWQEAEERKIEVPGTTLGEILKQPRLMGFTFPSRRWLEPLRGSSGEVAGVLVREQCHIEGNVKLAAAEISEGLFEVTVRVVNGTRLQNAEAMNRDRVLLQTLVSTHTILGVQHGEFLSLLDPPDPWRKAAAACCNLGTWPVLVGEEGAKDTLLPRPSFFMTIRRWHRKVRGPCLMERRSMRF